MAKIKGWRKQWEKGITTRYWGGNGKYKEEIQIGKYRDQDEFDKGINTKRNWHGKHYVDFLNKNKTRLFDTEKEAKSYLKNYMERH